MSMQRHGDGQPHRQDEPGLASAISTAPSCRSKSTVELDLAVNQSARRHWGGHPEGVPHPRGRKNSCMWVLPAKAIRPSSTRLTIAGQILAIDLGASNAATAPKSTAPVPLPRSAYAGTHRLFNVTRHLVVIEGVQRGAGADGTRLPRKKAVLGEAAGPVELGEVGDGPKLDLATDRAGTRLGGTLPPASSGNRFGESLFSWLLARCGDLGRPGLPRLGLQHADLAGTGARGLRQREIRTTARAGQGTHVRGLPAIVDLVLLSETAPPLLTRLTSAR